MSYYLYWIIGLLVFLVLALFVAKRRSSKIDHLPPEHVAKENELYEAFGLATPHKNEPPKEHDEKQKEVEAAFGTKPKGQCAKKATARKKVVVKTKKKTTAGKRRK